MNMCGHIQGQRNLVCVQIKKDYPWYFFCSARTSCITFDAVRPLENLNRLYCPINHQPTHQTSQLTPWDTLYVYVPLDPCASSSSFWHDMLIIICTIKLPFFSVSVVLTMTTLCRHNSLNQNQVSTHGPIYWAKQSCFKSCSAFKAHVA